MAFRRQLVHEAVVWNGRRALSLSNGAVGLTLLLDGGHFVDFRRMNDGPAGINVIWEAPYRTMDPAAFTSELESAYGPNGVGRFLSGYTGHALALDYFGPAPQSNPDLPLHGEIASAPWDILKVDEALKSLTACFTAEAPVRKLRLQRDIHLVTSEHVAYVRESVSNLTDETRPLHWVEHAAFGEPMLDPEQSVVALPGSKMQTWPLAYDHGRALLADNFESEWPLSKTRDEEVIDISQPFPRAQTGFVVAVKLDEARDLGYVAVLNWRLGLAAGYLFRRADFPWVAIWEENQARDGAPWSGRTRVRGLEFGSTPMPLGLNHPLVSAPLFGTPTFMTLAPGETRSAAYAMFIAQVPTHWRSITDIATCNGAIVIRFGKESVHLAATALQEFGLL